MTDKIPLKPPDGYKTWIDYAIATMDARTLHLESYNTDTVILSDDFRQAARDERDELVSAIDEQLEFVYSKYDCTAETLTCPHMKKLADVLARAKGEDE